MEENNNKNIRILHILGLVLVLVLMVALGASFTILIRGIMSIITASAGSSFDMDALETVGEIYGFGAIGGIGKAIQTISSVLGVLSFIGAFVSLAAAFVIIYFMRKRIDIILDNPVPFENPIKVKKAAYVWFGFLLGGVGGHLFLMKKKKAWIFLVLGILGTQIIPFLIYTSGISFADAFLACFIEKDIDGYIEVEDYSSWI